MAQAFFRHHEYLYYETGDVILSAKSSAPSHYGHNQHILFRVDSGILRLHSTVLMERLQALVAGPHPTYTNLPVLNMDNDAAEDLALLLGYVFREKNMVLGRHNPDTPLVVRRAIELAMKYNMVGAREALIQAVVSDWPLNLREWDVKQAEFAAIRKNPVYDAEGKWHFSDHVPEPVEAILFAVDFHCYQILPAAFYTLSLIRRRDDWDLRRTENQTSHRLARWDRLSEHPALYDRAMFGAEHVRDYRPMADLFLSARCGPDTEDPDAHSEWCRGATTDARPCWDYVANLFWIVWSGGPGVPRRLDDPLSFLSSCMQHQYNQRLSQLCPKGCCSHCTQSLAARLAVEREGVWAALDEWFGTGDVLFYGGSAVPHPGAPIVPLSNM